MHVSAALIETAERATLDALCPCAMDELDGWLLPYEPSVIGRAKSAVPLRHAHMDPSLLDEIARRYRARGLAPRFRIPDVPGLAALQAWLAQRGFTPISPTRVEWSTPAKLIALAPLSGAKLCDPPDDAWREAFIRAGEHGADEERERLSIIQRNPDNVFGEVREHGQVLSMGTAHVGLGILSLHGIRTAREARGRGLAGQLIAALGGAAQARGAEHALLQVEENNQAARALYGRAGFEHAWTYRYWVER